MDLQREAHFTRRYFTSLKPLSTSDSFFYIRMFAGWYYALYFDMNADFRVILKESLRSVPIYGWAMQIMMYIFVSRKREEDIPYLRKILSYLVCTGHSPSLLLFPEGTDLNESNKKKSNACKFFLFS